MFKTIKYCVAGFGNVGVRFAELLLEKEEELKQTHGYEFILTGICTRSKGALINREGLSLAEVLEMDRSLGRFDPGSRNFKKIDTAQMIEEAGADLFIELTTLSIEDGEPASSYIKQALNKKMDVITANKGPAAWRFRELKELADKNGRHFLYETIVMDGTPVFNLVQETLPGVFIKEIKGILNGTTNFILSELEKGSGYDEAVREAQRIKLAERDPSMDVGGWDGAAKICALANILMDANLTPKDAKVKSISSVAREDIEKAAAKGCRIKYICSAKRNEEDNLITLSVLPELISRDHLFSFINGTSAVVTLYTDLAGELTIVQTDPEILQTAYGVYSDLLTLVKRKEAATNKKI